MPNVPVATYRCQFNGDFTLRRACDLVPYFQKLGVSHLYASPLTQAHSSHGYDVTNHDLLNPLIGTEQDLAALSERLRSAGMGLILDIVPNHMFIGDSTNPWWNDLLENGPSSAYAHYFDIDWHPPRQQLANKVLLPFLHQQYGDALESQAIQVRYNNGSFYIEYSHWHLPLTPRTWLFILQPIAEALGQKLSKQDAYYLELQSIITALDHLPGVTETNPEKIKIRLREKEIIKGRLAALTASSETIRVSIETAVSEINGVKGDANSFGRLEEFLTLQPYRLAYWRVANDEINYRRFFDVLELAGIRAEIPAVFEQVHKLVFELVAKRYVDGLRIDHIDGLADPEQYVDQLQLGCQKALTGTQQQPFFVIAEKILLGDEKLRPEWKISGTVGYDFLNLVNGLFVRANREAMEEIYTHFIKQQIQPTRLDYQCKLLTLSVSMSSELNVLARRLDRIKEQHRSSRDITLEGLKIALNSIIAGFPVYRTYVRPYQRIIHDEDRQIIEGVVAQAKWLNPLTDPSIFDFIQDVLLLDWPEGLDEKRLAERSDFVLRFQQITAPVTAIGVENTALYRYFPLASLCEVGADLQHFNTSLVEFHQANAERLAHWPHSLLTTTTHDTKRSEDVRARLNVLSEMPSEWEQLITEWQRLNASKKEQVDGVQAPDANEEYLLYQTIVGAWPIGVERLQNYMRKALHEAKVHSSWINPNEKWDQAVLKFTKSILDESLENPFLASLKEVMPKIARAGMFNSLAQLVLKIASPGIPDIYQGNETWSFTLVDPDNRHPVDHSKLPQISEPVNVSQLLAAAEDGRIKFYVTQKALELRNRKSRLFQQGTYQPLQAEGEGQEHVVAFARAYENDSVIVAVGRFFLNLEMPKCWQTTSLIVPAESIGRSYTDVFTGKSFKVQGNIPLQDLFETLPVAILEKR